MRCAGLVCCCLDTKTAQTTEPYQARARRHPAWISRDVSRVFRVRPQRCQMAIAHRLAGERRFEPKRLIERRPRLVEPAEDGERHRPAIVRPRLVRSTLRRQVETCQRLAGFT